VFPLYEVEGGKYKMTIEMPKKLRPMEDYLKPQGRFRHLTPDQINIFRGMAMTEYNKVLERIKHSKPWSEMTS
jgi:pyruvate/2-oxoacid:ferredoxin oxidoreductase beta subunit